MNNDLEMIRFNYDLVKRFYYVNQRTKNKRIKALCIQCKRILEEKNSKDPGLNANDAMAIEQEYRKLSNKF